MSGQKIGTGTRLGSMILDYIFMTFVIMVFAIPGIVYVFSNAFDISHEPRSANFWGDTIYITLIGFALYFCKDSLDGRSPAKRILKLQVVNNVSGESASPLRCLLRNAFILIWPLEGIVALANPSRRIGDYVAGTKLVMYDSSKDETFKPKFVKIGLAVAFAYVMMLILMTPYFLLMSNLEKNQFTFDVTSLNKEVSNSTENFLRDSLGGEMVPDVRVYDKVKGNNLKYVSVIFKLNENFLNDQQKFQAVKATTTSLLLQRFPQNTFVGRIQFLYRSGSETQSSGFRLEPERSAPL